MKKIILTIVSVFIATMAFAQDRMLFNNDIQLTNMQYDYTVIQAYESGFEGLAENTIGNLAYVCVVEKNHLLYEGRELKLNNYYVYMLGAYSYINRNNNRRTVPILVFVNKIDCSYETSRSVVVNVKEMLKKYYAN